MPAEYIFNFGHEMLFTALIRYTANADFFLFFFFFAYLFVVVFFFSVLQIKYRIFRS